jgi:hypothetical protein
MREPNDNPALRMLSALEAEAAGEMEVKTSDGILLSCYGDEVEGIDFSGVEPGVYNVIGAVQERTLTVRGDEVRSYWPPSEDPNYVRRAAAHSGLEFKGDLDIESLPRIK